MKLLVVKPHLPVPPDQGTRRVTLGLLRDLSGEFDLSYLCMLEREDEAALIPEMTRMGVTVRAPLLPNRRSQAHRLWYRLRNDASALATGFPRDYYYSTPGVFARELERWTQEEAFDLVLLEYWKLARLAPHVRGARVAVLAHDAEFVRRARERALLKDPWRASRLRREEAREIEVLRGCETLIVLTERDREDCLQALGRDYRGAIHVLPFGPGFSPPERRRDPAPERVGFMGSFKGAFNVDALRFFLDEVWPLVRREHPNAELHVAGADAPADLREWNGRDGVRFLGYVGDLVDFIHGVGVFVVPLRFAGGLRIRLLEALACGAAIVATPVAVAGLELEAGRHHLEAADPAELAAAIGTLLEDPALARRLAEAGRTLAAARYGPEAIRDRTRSLFRSLARPEAA
jgi:glycosyltransferase involved in cell wall biosynthesis